MGIITSKVNEVLRQGLTPTALAWSLAYGIIGGVFPVPGTTTIICAFFIWMFSLNIAATQLANLLCTPLDLLLVIPFIRLGEAIFFVQHPVDSAALLSGLKSDFFGSLGVFAGSLMMAVCAWALMGALCAPLLYFALLPIVRSVVPQRKPLPE